MEKKREIIIETKEILNDFRDHLKVENNKRILFSGPFGTGKSTFLNEFSQTEIDDFFYLKIFPVNYSVSANEDVFELIKFDILFQLIGDYYDQIDLEKEDFTLLLKSQVFIMEHLKFMPLLYAILGFSEKIGTPIVDFIKALEQTVGNFKKFSDEIKIDEERDIKAFLKSIEQRKGSTYEMDAVSALIFNLIQRVKNKNNKSSVLIIDDLDRLDPEHIFRLFNIFSAHYNEVNGNNKFGFDKVIFVCDIENIRKIFHHRYGFDVDFSGYIDKFYSIQPFDFDSRNYVKSKIEELIYNIQFESSLHNYKFDNNRDFVKCTKAVIQALIDSRQLNLRMLLACPPLNVPNFLFAKRQSLDRTPIVILFYFFKNFYGSFEILHSKFKTLSELFSSHTFRADHRFGDVVKNEHDINILISYCLIFLLPDDLVNNESDEIEFYYSANYDCTFHYKIDKYFGYKSIHDIIKGKHGAIGCTETYELNPYLILFDVFGICKQRGLLK